MNLEEKILAGMQSYLKSDELNEKINAAIKKATDDVISNLFTEYRSPVKKIIDENLRAGLLTEMKNTDYSRSVVSLDLLVQQVIKDASAENNNTLKRFKQWATFEVPDSVKTSEIFEKYLKFVEENIDVSDLEVNTDEEPYYEGGQATMEITDVSSYSRKVKLECEKAPDLNISFEVAQYGNPQICFRDNGNSSLRMVDEFEFWLRNLEANDVKIDIDKEYMGDNVDIDEEPEPMF
ncbi:hypothetical protein [Lactiplantibacillus mudanjiangensis]|uniref:Uncharacterized protein n=1 Tax=Lactiplantibacillus mudanjiangensis TaxID=1296538 RepID=A0A660E463_9LACO|nr:hypothetical protein [Lactiplantibacillus mudanjiangensis]VDG24210.1 hypothetical protein MUDAN_IGPPGNFN_02479 [Lactiplantibacillus mudanjiangensis]VDG30188.1 hypothetical protein MUDAN_MDHGFNIF_01741 [Lactiplantibacillus mudanjiangensis]